VTGPFVGGCNGGRGADNPGGGGRGAGAFQISVAGAFDITGAFFSARGENGEAGSGTEGGGGGGGGGLVFLEAPGLIAPTLAQLDLGGGDGGTGGLPGGGTSGDGGTWPDLAAQPGGTGGLGGGAQRIGGGGGGGGAGELVVHSF
jgi:hypothetical protein